MKAVLADEVNFSHYDEILDVRAPIEFKTDHIPGAINLPVLDDDQRAQVGLIYKQQSVFEARKKGAGWVSANIARHINYHLVNKPGGYRPLVYCWRGGQRSNSFSTVLEQVGWPVTVLTGGYTSFRKRVLAELQSLPQAFEYRVLAGLTGTGKTEILQELQSRGEQVLDLECLADHQGSLLGEPEGGQEVGQKKFDTNLWHALSQMDPCRPVWTEAESSKIGRVFCPKGLLEMLRTSVRIEIQVPLHDRVQYISERYAHWQGKPDLLMEKLKWLHRRHGHAELARWEKYATTGQWSKFVQRILTVHYDPAYRRGALAKSVVPIQHIRGTDLLGTGCQQVAELLLATTQSCE